LKDQKFLVSSDKKGKTKMADTEKKVVVVVHPHNYWGTVSGAGLGALLGTSVFPVVGTAAGAVIGAIAGFVMRDEPINAHTRRVIRHEVEDDSTQ
jgi:uncharacterized membrane protein